MKDALGKDLKLGQRVAIPCNSKFKIGVLYNYRENRGKDYLRMVEYVASSGNGNLNDWTWRYWNQEKVDEQSHCYYIRFQDNKTRKIIRETSIIGISDEGTI